MLLAEIEECQGASVVRTHTFNRFNLKLEFEASLVQLEDDLDPGEAGAIRISLEQFKQCLQSTR